MSESGTLNSFNLRTLDDVIIYLYLVKSLDLSLPLYNHKGFDLVIPEWSSGFPYFLQFQSEFGNKEFMV